MVKSDVRKEVERKFVHVGIGLFIVLAGIRIESTFGMAYVRWFLLALTLICVGIDFVIADVHIKLPLYERLQRRHEKHGLHGHTYALLAFLVLLDVVELPVLIAASLMLVFGDAAAAVVGKIWGRHLLAEKKTWEGTIAMFMTSLVAGSIILGLNSVSVSAAIAATLAEARVNKINDGLVIPLVAGLVGQGVKWLMR